MADVAYCMKCREKREFTGSLVTLKNGRPALQGTCPACGTKLNKILGMDAAKAMGGPAPGSAAFVPSKTCWTAVATSAQNPCSPQRESAKHVWSEGSRQKTG